MVQKHFCWLAFLLAASLAGCSSTSNGKYFDKDGPPSSVSAWRAGSSGAMKIRVEPANKFANRPYTVMGQSFKPMTGDKPFSQTGTASWYGKQFHGKKTAIGEIYDMYAMTAAHPTMELPSYAKVTNLANGRSVIVRVNDRGPFIGGRAIDMSYAAAVKLGYQKKGTTKVRIERITRSQIARGDIPSATHTNVTLAAALASDTTTATKTSSSKAGAVLATASAVSAARSSGRAGVVKETVRQSASLLQTQPSASKTTASSKSTQAVSVTRPLTTLPSASTQEADAEVRRIQDTIASYLPSEENKTSGAAADPLASLVPSEDEAASVSPAASDTADDAAFDSVFPESGSVETAAADAGNLKLLDSGKTAWGAQIGAFDNKTNAQEFAAHTEMMLTTEGITEPVRVAPSGDRWCVMVGSTTQARAREIARTISDRLGTTAFAAFK